ncbi:putative conserved protein [Rhizobium favelukesii]|uniref:Conserved protein n=1 Tax=Rhizobium favelukesii TaxID=348824 RepID=W6R8A4_9HYPH|nr:putative conserved protein [Rhizobium favelukesii]
MSALRDARRTDASIFPASMDHSIYFGSPIWLYSPAPPIWEFIKSNDLSGKKVVLFNLMNSKFDQKYIDEPAELVRQKGGSSIVKNSLSDIELRYRSALGRGD